jgi:beta-N-acetylhexosaminidase
MGNNVRIPAVALGLLAAVAIVATIAAALTGESGTDGADLGSDSTTSTPVSSTTTSTSTTTTTTAGEPLPTTSESPPPDPPSTRLDALVADMTTEEIARQLVVTGLTGSDAAGRLSGTVGGSCLGGVFVTESNGNWPGIGDATAASSFIDEIRESARADACPSLPLVMTDAELGEVVRVPVDSPAAARSYGRRFDDGDQDQVLADLGADVAAYATALRNLGIDVNFGAVADVDISPDTFMARSGRTFGADPATVATLSAAFVDAHCAAGIAAALKHFPNQAATLEDPHQQRSTAAGGVERWRETGRLPYVDTRAPIVMTGHILMDVDPLMPASMSVAITTGLLREDLGYQGVIITDDLSAMRGAIDVIGDAGDRAIAAIRAGADLVLFVSDRDVPGVVDALVEAMTVDPDFEASARESVRRVADLKAALGAIPDVAIPTTPLCP